MRDMNDAERLAEAQAALRREHAARSLARVPRRFRGGLETLEQVSPLHAEVVAVLRTWCENFGPDSDGWYISGGVGTGKSGVAYGIWQDLLLRGFDARLWFVPDLFAELRDAIRPDSPADKDVEDIIREASMADCLILDDLAAELSTDWTIKTLSQIVDRRYRDMRPVVVTSNLSGAELLRQMPDNDGKRIVSRLCEMVEGLKLDGADMRRTKKETAPVGPDEGGNQKGD